MTIKCYLCSNPVQIVKKEKAISFEGGAIVVNFPGVACSSCIASVPIGLPATQDLTIQRQLTVGAATDLILHSSFKQPTDFAVSFLLEIFTEESSLWCAGAQRLHQEGFVNTVWILVNHGIENLPNPDPLRIQGAAMRAMEGQAEEAMELLQDVSDQSAERFYVVKGNVLKSLDRWEEAAKCWEQAIKIDPSDFHPWNNLGYYLQQISKDHISAEKIYQRALVALPNVAAFQAHLGDSLYHQGKYEEAIRHYENALSMSDEQYAPYDSDSMRISIEGMIESARQEDGS